MTGTFSDDSRQDLTSVATWTSAATPIASISATGLATGITAGAASVSAAYAGKSASTEIHVTPPILLSIAITPATVSFAKGTTKHFTVTGSFSDNTTQDLTDQTAFTSTSPTIASVSVEGLVRGLSLGSTTIAAVAKGKSAITQAVNVTAAVLVSIAVTPNNPSLAKGTDQQFTAIGTFSDGTTQNITEDVIWTSSNADVMTIDQNGLGSSDQIGSVAITASLNGVSYTTGSATITAASLTNLTLSPTAAQIAKGTTRQFIATGTYTDGTSQNLSSNVTWTSSNSAVVTIDALGIATATGVGTATLTAAYQGHTVSTTSFAVTPATLVSIVFLPAHPTVAPGTSTQVTVLGIFSDGSTQDLSSSSIYTSSNPAAVTVSPTGLITGIAPGLSTVTVTVDGQTSSFMATVTDATLVSIVITPLAPAPLAKGTTEQFTATGTYSDGSTQNLSSTVAWTSSDPTVFTIDANGLATGVGVGLASLSASYQGKTASTASFQVTAATVASLAITPNNASINSGNTQQFTAIVTYTDSTTQTVSSTTTWVSSNPTALTIDANGLATAQTTLLATVVTVIGQYGSATSSVSITVQPVGTPTLTLTSLSVIPTSARIATGTSGQFSARGTYSDGSTADISNSVLWTSSNPLGALVSNTGLATAILPGTVTVQATSGLLQSQATLVVTAATLSSVAISPSGANFANGTREQFTLTGTFSDGSTQDLSSSASWSSSATATATISSTGLATGVAPGTAQFTASYQGRSATTGVVTVTAATLVSITISPSSLSFADQTSQQFTITGTYSDGTTQNLTNQATYVSSDSDVVTISTTGLATGVGVGSAQITATVGGETISTHAVTVTSATLVSIAVTPSTPTLATETTQQFIAVGTYSDGTTQDLSSEVIWTSSNPQVLTINAAGLAKATAWIGADYRFLDGISFTTGDATVTAATLTNLAITPASAMIAKGTTQQLTATGTYLGWNNTKSVDECKWTSSDDTVASINAMVWQLGQESARHN